MRVLVLLSLLAAAYAACPNDCSGHGTCNIYSACECYRNWMAADCSERVCYFGHAFIDTPQGDLNADGRVDRFTNTYKVVIGSDKSFFAGQAGLATGTNALNMLLGRKTLSVREKHGVGFVAGAARTTFKISSTEYTLEKNVLTEYTTDTTILTSLSANQDSDIYGYAEACANDSTVNDSSIKYAIEVLVTDSGLAKGNEVADGMVLVDGDAMGADVTAENVQYAGWRQIVCFNGAHGLSAGATVTQAATGASGIVLAVTASECGTAANGLTLVLTSTAMFDVSAADSGGTALTVQAATDSADNTPTNVIGTITGAHASVNRSIKICSVKSAVYNTQWATADQAEAYPTNHADGCKDCSYPGAAASAAAAATAKAAYDEAHFYRECSNKGLCNRGSGTCECHPGYVGEGCTRTACPNDCSGHGVCRRAKDIDKNFMGWDAYKTQSCVCDAGFEGVDCSQRQCPFGDDPVTRINDLNEIQVFGYAEAGTVTSASTQASGTTTGTYDTGVVVNGAIPANRDKMYPIKTDTVACETKFAVGDEVYDASGNFICKIASISSSSTECDIYCEDNMENGSEVANDTNLFTFPDNGVLCGNGLMAAEANPGTTKNAGVASNALFSLEFQDEFGDKWTTKSINFMSDTVAADVEAALEALPNDVLSDVEVSLVNGNVAGTSATVFGELTRGRYIAVTFLHNSGDIPMLGARYEFNYSDPTWDTNGLATLADVCTKGSLKTTTNKEDGSFDNRGPFKIMEATKGNKENAVCSNRGLCDYSSGICKCFAGFTDYDCSVQNALASG